MFSTLPMLFVLAVSAVEPDANFFDVPAKEIDWKDAPVIDLDAPSSFPITLQPYQPPKLPAPLKPVTFEHSAVQRRFGEYLFYFDTQTARCVYLTQSSVDQKPREKTTGVFEGYAGDMLTGQVEKIFAFAFKERLTVHFPNAPERLPRVQSCRLSPDGTKMLINMDTNAPDFHTSYLVQCENFKPVKVLHAFRKRHFDWLNDQIVIGEDVPIVLRISDQKILWRMPPYVEMEAICPAGRRYVVARKYKDSSPILPDTLFLFDAEQGRVVGYFEDTPQEEMSWYRFAFSPDGTRLAGCRWNSNYCVNVRIWDTATGKKSADFIKMANNTTLASFSPITSTKYLPIIPRENSRIKNCFSI